MTTERQSLLSELCTSEVDFILVGGMAAILHGVPVVTHDIDIVPGGWARKAHRDKAANRACQRQAHVAGLGSGSQSEKWKSLTQKGQSGGGSAFISTHVFFVGWLNPIALERSATPLFQGVVDPYFLSPMTG